MKQLHLTFIALMSLLALTVGASFLDLGAVAIYVSLLIAFAKAALVITIFMQARQAGPLIRLTLLFSGIWVMFFYVLSSTDFLTRY